MTMLEMAKEDPIHFEAIREAERYLYTAMLRKASEEKEKVVLQMMCYCGFFMALAAAFAIVLIAKCCL